MSEQPRMPARGPDPGRENRDEQAPGRGAPNGTSDEPTDRQWPVNGQTSVGPDSGPDNGVAPLHPWQPGASTAGTRAVPADPGPPTPSQHVSPERGENDEASRLRPKPVQRPAVGPEQSSVFGRPSGVDGSFDPPTQPDTGARAPEPQKAPPPPESLAQAFGRPADSDESVQRAPDDHGEDTKGHREKPFWNTRGYRDPWRDPAAGAALGPPAQPEPEPDDETPEEIGPRLSAREVLFGRRVRPKALVILGAFAVVLALVGGLLGRLTAEESNPLTNPDVTLPEPQPGAHRPAGSVAGVAKRVLPSVVSVETRVGGQGGTGSGVVIDGNGYILTNNHVVSMAADTPNAKVSAVFQGDRQVPARIVGRDPKTDLAVIKVEIANPTVAPLGRSSDLAVGDDVVAIGSPLGLADTVTTGIVSSLHRPVRLAGEGSDTNAVIDAVQTDASINPGNSGGALVDGNGSVIGINSAIRSQGQGGSIGIGFAIPINDARRVAEQLIHTGHAQHADLGVNARTVNDGVSTGAQVQNIQDNSVAAGAGIAEGDVITRVGDRRVHTADELVVAVNARRLGEDMPVTVVRQGRELVLNAKLR